MCVRGRKETLGLRFYDPNLKMRGRGMGKVVGEKFDECC